MGRFYIHPTRFPQELTRVEQFLFIPARSSTSTFKHSTKESRDTRRKGGEGEGGRPTTTTCEQVRASARACDSKPQTVTQNSLGAFALEYRTIEHWLVSKRIFMDL